MQIGDRIGKYQILRPLGKGGEGSVFLAMHMLTQHLWAVKEIRKMDGEREYHELSVFKKCRHPSLPMIVDVLETPGSVCLVMEYINGISFETLLQKQGHLSVEQVLDLAKQVCSALCYLHDPARGILHLDLKPNNVLLTEKGSVYLVDFGAALFAEGEAKVHLVTDGYSAPEMYQPELVPDERADVYGLGALMYSLISGVRYGDFMEKSRVPGCPENFERVIRQCLRTDPEERYQNMQQVQQALQAVKKGQKRENVRVRFYLALLLAVFTVYGACTAVSDVIGTRLAPEWSYEKCIREATCLPDEEAYGAILKAVSLQPENSAAYHQYLALCDADGILTEDEENNLRSLLYRVNFGQEHTNEELLQAVPETYAELAYLTGCIYWHDYKPDSGGGKRIGAGWFAKAESAAENISPRPDWYETAGIYCRIGSFYEGLQNGTNAFREDVYQDYWEELGQLLSGKQVQVPKGSESLQLRFCIEAIDQITLLSRSLAEHGIATEEMLNMIQSWQKRAETIAAEEVIENIYLQNLLAQILEKAENAEWVISNL